MNKLCLLFPYNGFFIVFFSGCGLVSGSDSLCGVDKYWRSNLGTEPSYESLDALTGNRIFQFEDLNAGKHLHRRA